MIDVDRVERTPAFVLEHEALQRNLEVIKDLQESAPVTFLLALKGFAMHAVFPLVAKAVRGATASSLNEALLANEFFDEVHAYAPAYLPREFPAIAKIAKHITFNSIAEHERYRNVLDRQHIALRINPEYSPVATDLYNPCAPGSRLGVSETDLRKLPPGVTGLHAHNLCESDAQHSAATLERIEQLFGHLFESLSFLNLGGGHLVTRKGYRIDILTNALQDFHARHPHIELILEPGAAFAWETGVLVATVLDIVKNGPMMTAMLDTSFATHMPDCLEMPYTPRVRGARIIEASSDAGDGYRIRLGGASCLAGDWVGDYLFDEPVRIGQRLVFEDMMHYTMVKTTMFNGIALPDIVIFENGWPTLVRRFGHEEYRARLC